MEKFIDFFITNNLNKDADYVVKERLLVTFLLFMMALNLLMIPSYLYLEVYRLLTFLYLMFAGCISILVYFKYTDNLKFGSFLFIFSLYLYNTLYPKNLYSFILYIVSHSTIYICIYRYVYGVNVYTYIVVYRYAHIRTSVCI